MKKIALLIILMTFSGEMQAEPQPDRSGRVSKNGKFKRKKGFMWGLFKKKNDCDCPKN